jgi:phage/plasmid-like protein (TIGR03299 family)
MSKARTVKKAKDVSESKAIMAGAPDTIAYSGPKPWSTSSAPIPEGSTAEQILELAGLNWPVHCQPIEYTNPTDGQVYTTETRRVLFRGDNATVLDTVGSDYQPFQNSEIMEFFREYAAAGDLNIDTAGSFEGGRRIWVLADLKKAFSIGDDEVKGYVLLMNPHIYGKGFMAKLVKTRVVCANTLAAALREGGESIKIWHNKQFNSVERQKVAERLGVAREMLDAFKQEAELLASTILDQDTARKLAIRIVGKPGKELSDQPRVVLRVLDLYNGSGMGSQLASAKDTAWGLLNGVTQYLDHEYGKKPEIRMNRAWFGEGDVQKRKAFTTLLTYAQKGELDDEEIAA